VAALVVTPTDVFSEAAQTGCRGLGQQSVIAGGAVFDVLAAQCGQRATCIAGMASARGSQPTCEATIQTLQTEVEQIGARLRSNEGAFNSSLTALEESVEALCEELRLDTSNSQAILNLIAATATWWIPLATSFICLLSLRTAYCQVQQPCQSVMRIRTADTGHRRAARHCSEQ